MIFLKSDEYWRRKNILKSVFDSSPTYQRFEQQPTYLSRIVYAFSSFGKSKFDTFKKYLNFENCKKYARHIGLSVGLLLCVVFVVIIFKSAQCSTGYEGKGCADIDECSASKHTCYRNFNCRNTLGSFDCYCLQGFNATEEDCIDINECETGNFTCPENSICQNTEGGYQCKCNSGFEKENCADSNECLIGSHHCHKNAECSNTFGSFTCSCKTGHYGTGRECFEGQCHDAICKENHVCISPTTIGCKCKSGFTKNGTGLCADFDECAEETTCDANSNCTNTSGSYKCSCNSGFVGDGKYCQKGSCVDDDFCPKNERCVSLTGIKCTCKIGFERDSNGNCVDTNECKQTNVECPENSICENTEGSFTCVCIIGYDGEACSDVNECSDGIHQCRNSKSNTTFNSNIDYVLRFSPKVQSRRELQELRR